MSDMRDDDDGLLRTEVRKALGSIGDRAMRAQSFNALTELADTDGLRARAVFEISEAERERTRRRTLYAWTGVAVAGALAVFISIAVLPQGTAERTSTAAQGSPAAAPTSGSANGATQPAPDDTPTTQAAPTVIEQPATLSPASSQDGPRVAGSDPFGSQFFCDNNDALVITTLDLQYPDPADVSPNPAYGDTPVDAIRLTFAGTRLETTLADHLGPSRAMDPTSVSEPDGSSLPMDLRSNDVPYLPESPVTIVVGFVGDTVAGQQPAGYASVERVGPGWAVGSYAVCDSLLSGIKR